MGQKQNKIGSICERLIAKHIFKKGYWVYDTPKGVGGQPVDLIIAKGDTIWLLDAKHLELYDKSFPFSRVEPNQRTSMRMAKIHANIKNLGFIIYWEDSDNILNLPSEAEIDPNRLFFLSYDKLIELENEGLKSVKLENLSKLGEIL